MEFEGNSSIINSVLKDLEKYINAEGEYSKDAQGLLLEYFRSEKNIKDRSAEQKLNKQGDR